MQRQVALFLEHQRINFVRLVKTKANLVLSSRGIAYYARQIAQSVHGSSV